MPSLFRFLFTLAVFGGLAFAALYVLATYFEPEPREVTQPLIGVEVQRQ